MSKSFDATVQIVSSRLSNSTMNVDMEGGKSVAAYIHGIYKELSVIEMAEADSLGNMHESVELKN